MSVVAYVNGRYHIHSRASVHIEDRGFQFSDGVYEVIAVRNGRPVDETLHMDRLDYSLGQIRLPWPVAPTAFRVILREVANRNRIRAFGLLYVQVTRGSAPRNHAFPTVTKATLVVTGRPLRFAGTEDLRKGVAVITAPDLRWKRCDIKAISLLPNVLAKQAAIEAGAYETWMVDEHGLITEGSASNAWIVSEAGDLVTRHADWAILNGITRRVIVERALDLGLRFVERPFAVAEVSSAREAFLTSTTSLVKPVVKIDGQTVGEGGIGALTESLLQFYQSHMDQTDTFN
ncbi:MAG: D-amino-acid transaminase [Hyphomicrobiales bacterium]|nr:D-amino-acid transaminase [Hyphomicrobiales bacterium]